MYWRKDRMKNILCTISGGRTSGFMAVFLKERYPKENLLFCFANTGKENEQTLIFLDKIDKEFNLGVIWLEAVTNEGKGNGTTYKEVDFKTASRNGEPFEPMFKKYGLPSKLYRHCTREGKEKPIHKYAKEFFGSNDYETALGIRADEKHRASPKKKVIYPLVEINIDERFIKDWWKKQSFDLQLEDFEGNCDFCFLKSQRKRMKLLKNGLDVSWWQEMEELHKRPRQPMFDVRNDYTIAQLIELNNADTQLSIFEDSSFDCFCKN